MLCAATLTAQAVTVTRNVNLRLDSSTDQAPIQLLRPPTRLELLQPDDEDGFFNVRTAEGQEGWVWSKNVRVTSGPPSPGIVAFAAPKALASSFDEDWEKPEPNKSTFTGPSGKCGWAGTGDESEANQRKNRTDPPDVIHEVPFSALAGLPDVKGPKERSNWSEEDFAEVRKYEGVAVRVKGFLVAVKPQSGSKENTNCRFSTAAETDWHMALTEDAGQGEKEAVVVETTPKVRKKHSKWTKSRLAPWTDTNLPVRITGWVFFDTEHRNHLKKYRSTLWEIHPITRIEVLKSGKWVDDVP